MAVLLAVAIGPLQWWQGAQAHTPYLFGILEMLPLHKEPVNALSTATWITHSTDLISNRNLAKLWNHQVKTTLAWSQLLLVYALVAVLTFHFYYNQIGPLLLSFGLLLGIQSLVQAYAVDELYQHEKQEPTPFVPEGYGVGRFVFASIAVSSVLGLTIKTLSGTLLASVDPTHYPTLGILTMVVGWVLVSIDFFFMPSYSKASQKRD